MQLTQYDWQYKTIEQENSHKRQFNWPRGKIIGGSSGINAMLYVRGNAEDYNKWSHELGCTGWSYNEVLPYFIKSEKCRLKTCQSEFHGQSGSLVVNETANGEPNIIAKKFVEACNESGILYNPDYNGSIQEGAALSQVSLTRNLKKLQFPSFKRLPQLKMEQDVALQPLSLTQKLRSSGVI